MTLFKTQTSIAKAGNVVISLVLNLALFVGIVFGVGNLDQTLIKPLPAEASPYQMAQVNYSRTDLDEQQQQDTDAGENLIDHAREKLKETADTVREKLNLDEPISPSTKAFVEDVKEKVAHPFTGDEDLVDNQSNWNY